MALVLLALLVSIFAIARLEAHETIDTQQANALLAAADAATADAKTAAGSRGEGEARFALGMALVEATDILNRDLAAHNGRLAFNAEHLLKALAQRDLAPRFDQAIGRYRAPIGPLEQARRLAPDAPYAARARFELLKTGFYESFVLDPFELFGIGLDAVEAQIAEADALAGALPSPDDAEEAAFIRAVDLARVARLAPRAEAKRAYTASARTALAAFTQTYPESMRAAAAGVILKGLGGTE
jgi:hypothetical protein